MIWRIPGISLNLHYPKEDDGELYTACPIIKGSRGIEPLNPLPQRRIRLTLPAYLCLKTALRRSEIREYYNRIDASGLILWHNNLTIAVEHIIIFINNICSYADVFTVYLRSTTLKNSIS